VAGVWSFHGGRWVRGTRLVEIVNWSSEWESERRGSSGDKDKRRNEVMRFVVGQGRLIGFREGGENDVSVGRVLGKGVKKRFKRLTTEDSQGGRVTNY